MYHLQMYGVILTLNAVKRKDLPVAWGNETQRSDQMFRFVPIGLQRDFAQHDT
ncbi:MAG: hypothetical protein AB1728_13475 [Bacteroidota bacterium]